MLRESRATTMTPDTRPTAEVPPMAQPPTARDLTHTTAEDRAIGALLGLATGDAVGTTLEFRKPGSFEPITDLVGGGPFSLEPGQWTDDTSMALCLAESLLDTGEMDLRDQLRRYVLWQTRGYLSSNGRCFDIGGTTSSQLSRFGRTEEPVDPSPSEESAANGSLMRLAPVPIRWHADPGEAADRSADSSRTTHAARRPVDACRVLGAMVASLIGGTDADEVLDPGFWQWGDLDPQVEAIVRGSWRTKEPPMIRGTGFCIDALEAALWAVGGATGFRDAVLRAANLGDDADTTAAIAGQLAGARWGASGIPAEWRERIALRDRIEQMASVLFRAGGGRPDDERWRHDELQHAWWVEPGAVLAGEYPASLDRSKSRQKLEVLVDAGVRTLIDLTEPHELEPYAPTLAEVAEARRLDLRRVHMPIPDMGVVEDDSYAQILQAIADGRARGVVYVHCWGGMGRTSTVIGCLLARSGATYDEVIARLGKLRAGTRKADAVVPQSRAQHDFLRRTCGQ
jgi:ADP-ribosyl-[dinitrogen reductase] hydrolase